MSTTIAVNEPDFQISLSTTHTFLGNSTEISSPYLLDSRIIGSVLFSFSGTLDQSISVPPVQMLHSSAIKTFLHHLTINAERLCICAISELILEDQCPQVSVTLSRSADLCSSPCAHVLSIHIAYNWTSSGQQSSGLSIFSPQIFLPLQPALNKLVHKLFSVHIAGRYPWLFGPLRTKLRLELRAFPSLVRSLLAITARSESLNFRTKSQALFKRIHSRASIYKQVVGDTHRSLSSRDAPRSCPLSPSVEASDEDMLVLALELVLKIAARSPPFKVAGCLATSKQSFTDDEDTLDFSEPASCRLSQTFPDETLSWGDFVPAEVCLSGYWALGHKENIWSGESDEDIAVGDDELYSILQTQPSEGSRFTVSERSLISRSNCDSGFHEEGVTSTDVSPLLAPERCTRMRKHTCPPLCENFTAPDHDLDTQSDFCIFDNDIDAMLLAFD